jgi:hypothetical protein
MPHHPSIRIVPHSHLSRERKETEHSTESICVAILGGILLFFIALTISKRKD